MLDTLFKLLSLRFLEFFLLGLALGLLLIVAG